MVVCYELETANAADISCQRRGTDRYYGAAYNPLTSLLKHPMKLIHQPNTHEPPAPWRSVTISRVFPISPLLVIEKLLTNFGETGAQIEAISTIANGKN